MTRHDIRQVAKRNGNSRGSSAKQYADTGVLLLKQLTFSPSFSNRSQVVKMGAVEAETWRDCLFHNLSNAEVETQKWDEKFTRFVE